MRRWAIGILALALAGCAVPEAGARPGMAGAACAVASLRSRAGREWLAENRWRFADDAAAAAAYAALAATPDPSPWPDWYKPYDTTLPPGTRFQMALAAGQSPDSPGNWGTFDFIWNVRDVRDHLAVRTDWKPSVDRVVTYEVMRPLPVRIGPIGQQVDPKLCALLPGHWSQFQALVEKGTLRGYLTVVEVRGIR
jgi:hypothetical protein